MTESERVPLEAVWSAISSLPVEERKAVQLYYSDDGATADDATRLLVRQALPKLRKALVH